MVADTRKHVHIVGTGRYLPQQRLDNQVLGGLLGVTSDWITRRTGILQRHVASSEQATSDLAIEAGREAIRSSGLLATDIDLVIVAVILGL